ncbi:MAG TPA: hypothetical protein VE291_09015 [Terracidiphilus sp.]|jgi:hypothetical protein|nr:hypothetical protein [Terracidiphilus sp.]
MRLHRILILSLLLAAVALAARPAFADRDEVQFGTNITIPAGGSVHDAVCFFCSVDAIGTVDHDVVVFFGNVHVAAHSNHDVVVFFGTVRADDNASIGHDLVNFFGNVRLGENVSVGGDMVSMFGATHAADTVSVAGSRVLQPGWVLLIPLLILGSMIYGVVSAVRCGCSRRQYMAAYPFPPHPPMPPTPPQA